MGTRVSLQTIGRLKQKLEAAFSRDEVAAGGQPWPAPVRG
jgi:hypothetical protein